MSVPEFSPGVLKELEVWLGHPAPYSKAELGKITILIVMNEREPRGLEHLTHAEQLGYRGCEVVDLEVARVMPDLWSLTSWSSNFTSVASLPQVAPKLRWLEITVGQVRDLRPLLDLPLETCSLAGNPIDEVSFREVYPELQRRGAVNIKRPKALLHEREWALMQRFVERGLRLSAWQVSGQTKISAPGQLVYEAPELGGVTISVRQAGRILDENPGIDERGFLDEAGRVRKADGYVE